MTMSVNGTISICKMIKIVIEDGVYVYDLPERVKETLKKTSPYPTNNILKLSGMIVTFHLIWKPEFIYYVESKSENCILVPRGYIYPLLKYIRYTGKQYRIVNKTLTLDEINLKFIGKPRPYQKKAIQDILRYPVGILEAATGAGKTFMGTNMIVRRKQPTIILVHTKELLYQWRDSIKKFIGYDAGLLGDGHF